MESEKENEKETETPRRKSTGSRILKIVVAFLVVMVGAEFWLMAEMRHDIKDLRANEPAGSALATGPGGAMMGGQGSSSSGNSGKLDNWNPYVEMEHMRDRMDELFRESLGRFDDSPTFRSLVEPLESSPNVDVQELKDRYVVRVDVPGARERDIVVKLDGQRLTVSGKRVASETDKDADNHYLEQEREVGEFSRTLTLPKPVKSEGMTSKLDNGVLEITIPKA